MTKALMNWSGLYLLTLW